MVDLDPQGNTSNLAPSVASGAHLAIHSDPVGKTCPALAVFSVT